MFKAGDTIRMKEDCSGLLLGEIYILKKFSDGLWAGKEKEGDAKGCSCSSNWELVKEGGKMSKVGDFKVGDKVRCIEGPQTHDGNEKRGSGWKLGREFIIERITGDICWPDGGGSGVWEDNLELAGEKKFKVGDEVRQIQSGYGTASEDNGKIATVLKIGQVYAGKDDGITIDDTAFHYKQSIRGEKGFELAKAKRAVEKVKKDVRVDFYTACGKNK